MPRELVLTENQLPSEVIRAIEEGRKVEAIKLLREATGLELANAKVLVDRVARTRGPKKPIYSPADPKPPIGRWVASAVAIMVLASAYYFYYYGL
ncbi:MAG: hypothetical protein R3192_04375 [Woeseiaceae bacterium]|nr:hypothetical protein [Woeseiaceae bacterium]